MSMVFDQFGRLYEKPVAEGGRIDPGGATSIRNDFSGYPSRGLTPESLTRIFTRADSGDMTDVMELFEEMEEKDTQIASVLQTRKQAVIGLDWEVTPASEDQLDQNVAEFTRASLGDISNLEDAFFDMLDAIGKGYSASEIIWKTRNGHNQIKNFRWWNPKAFTYLDTDGTVSEIPKLITDESPVYGELLQPGKWVLNEMRTRSGMINRAGILRTVAWLYLFKNYTLKDWIALSERLGFPLRIGTYKSGTSDAERQALKQAVFNLGTDAAAVISESTVIEIIESSTKTGSVDMFNKLISYADKSMTKTVLGHSGSSESTPGSLGGEDQAESVRDDILAADAKTLATSFRRDAISPLVLFNFGPNVRVPGFDFITEEAVDLQALAEQYRTLSEMGLEIPVALIRKKFNLPEAAEGEETLKPRQAFPGVNYQ